MISILRPTHFQLLFEWILNDGGFQLFKGFGGTAESLSANSPLLLLAPSSFNGNKINLN